MKNHDWENMSNSNIKQVLMEMKYEHESIKSKVSKLLGELKKIETEYVIANKTIIKRMKGE